ncbi:hypothetical protein MJD09_26390, partial [bacterium]|nr:hypothetical protein [bacterium]
MRKSGNYRNKQPRSKRRGTLLLDSREICSWRIKLLRVLFLLFGMIIFTRLFEIQVWDHTTYAAMASKQYQALQLIKGSRGIIYDRDRTPLALNRPCYDIGIHRAQVENIESTGNSLSKVLGLSSDRIQNEILG